MSEYIFLMTDRYASDRTALSQLKNTIQTIEAHIQENPYGLFASEYTGKQYKGMRYTRIGRSIYRLVFICCKDARKKNRPLFDVAADEHDFSYKACKFNCDSICIKQPDNTIVFLAIWDIAEQDRLVGGHH